MKLDSCCEYVRGGAAPMFLQISIGASAAGPQNFATRQEQVDGQRSDAEDA